MGSSLWLSKPQWLALQHTWECWVCSSCSSLAPSPPVPPAGLSLTPPCFAHSLCLGSAPGLPGNAASGVKWKKSFGFWPEHRYRRAVSSVLWFCGSVYYLVIIEEQGSGWSVPLETWHLTGLQRASPSCHNRHFHAVVVLSFCQARIKILQLFGCLVTLASKGSSEMFVSREWTVLAPLAHNQRAKTMAKNSSALYLS